MEIIATSETLLNTIKEQFSKKYEGLKLEFYNKKHGTNEGSKADSVVPENTKIADLNPDFISGEIVVNIDDTVESLEHNFENTFSLHAQVFRKMGEIWIQTTTTDHLTLKEQLALVNEYKN